MSKESLEQAYQEVAKAEKAALAKTQEIAQTTLEALEKELAKFPDPAPQSSGVAALQHLQEILRRELQNLDSTLALYQTPADDAASEATL